MMESGIRNFAFSLQAIQFIFNFYGKLTLPKNMTAPKRQEILANILAGWP